MPDAETENFLTREFLDNMDSEISGSMSVCDETREKQRFVFGECVVAAKAVPNSTVFVLSAMTANSPHDCTFPLATFKGQGSVDNSHAFAEEKGTKKIVDLLFNFEANTLFEYLRLIMDELNVPDTCYYVCFDIQPLSTEGLQYERAQMNHTERYTTYLFNRGDKSHAYTISKW